MSKKQHDEAAGEARILDYEKIWFQKAIKVLEGIDRRGFTMLDMGCGNAEFSELAKKHFEARVTCLDYADSHLERVRKSGFETVRCNFDDDADVEHLVSEYAGRFDVVSSLEVIEHIFDVDTYLATAYSLLKPGGLLLISTPNIGYRSFRLYSMFCGNLPVSEGHHIRFFNRRRMEQTLILNGFDQLQFYGFGQGDFYLDRAIGEKTRTLKGIVLRIIFKLWGALSWKTLPSHYSGLIFLAVKAERKPVGLDPTVRDSIYTNLSGEKKKVVLERLLPLRNSGFFDEHPGLREFIDQEAERAGFQDL